MTRHTRTTVAQFHSLKVQAVNAIFAAYDRETQALDTGRPHLARSLHESRERISALLLEIRRAEAVFARSPAPACTAEAQLRDLTRTLKRANAGLKRLATAQAAAREVTQTLIDLGARFK